MADVNMLEQAVAKLRDDGHDVLFVKDEQPRAPDPDILAWATHESRLLITYICGSLQYANAWLWVSQALDKNTAPLVFEGGSTL